MRVGQSHRNNDSAALKEIERAFAKHRRMSRGKGAGFPMRLKNLAQSAVAKGHSAASVAEAARISSQSILNWTQGKHSIPGASPRELKLRSVSLVQDVVQNRPPASVIDLPLARISLGGGVVIEVPVSALTPSLFEALNGGGQ